MTASHSPTSDTSATSVDYTEYLFDCLSKRLEVLKALQTVGQSQREAATGDDTETLLNVLSRKQSLLDQLEGITKLMAPYYTDDPDARVWSSQARRDECRIVAEQGNAILREAAQNDQAAIDEVSRRRDAVAAQLRDGTDSTLARSAYQSDNVLGDGQLDIQDI